MGESGVWRVLIRTKLKGLRRYYEINKAVS